MSRPASQHSPPPRPGPEVTELTARLAEQEWINRDLQRQLSELRSWRALWKSRRSIQRLGRFVRRGCAIAGLVKKAGRSLLGAAAALPIRLLHVLGFGQNTEEADEAASLLRVGLRTPIPDELVIGKGMSLIISGWAFHPSECIRRLRVKVLTASVNPDAHRITEGEAAEHFLDDIDESFRVTLEERPARLLGRNLPSPDVLACHSPHDDPNGFTLNAGFLAEVAIPPVAGLTRAQIVVSGELRCGRIETATIARLTLLPDFPAAPPLPSSSGSDSKPRIVICQATFNPPIELFQRQIESIRGQTWTNWVCLVRDDASDPFCWEGIRRVIGDDSRFILHRNPTNVGFYANFEALLADVPAEADFVALSDQDDVWNQDKLEELARRFDPGVSLVFSDMRIVDPHGSVLTDTFWGTRRNNYTDYSSFLLANALTGAAAMFRRSLLEYLLPLPQRIGGAYHDHWLGLVSMAVGEVRYVSRPLYDYIQHSNQVVGHRAAPAVRSRQRFALSILKSLNPITAMTNLRAYLRAGRDEHDQLLRVAHAARNVLQRCGKIAPRPVVSALREAIDWRDGRLGALRLIRRGFRPGAAAITCGVEWRLLQARIWATVQRFAGAFLHRLAAAGLLQARTERTRERVAPTHRHAGLTRALSERTAPLTLAVRAESLPRVNIVTSVINFKYLFGGYLTVFNLARMIAERGWRVRLILVDECDFQPAEWAAAFKAYRGLERFLEQVELVYAYDRETAIPASPNDVFLATSWWTAHVSHAATRAIGRERFVYLIQEYEPGFYPLGAQGAFAAESYTFPHYALFSTNLLQNYFREHRLGVFAGPFGERDSIPFENAITSVGAVDPATMLHRPRRLLFYCRPELHAARNLFEIGFLGLKQAIRAGAFHGWELHGIGSVDVFGELELSEGVRLKLLPRMTQDEYRRILPDYDVGMSLMWTPHPSLVPLEMAGAGLCTVTTTFANKTAEALRAISANLIPVEGTVSAVSEGLRLAERLSTDIAARVKGAEIRWATTWEDAFPEAVMARLEGYFRAAMESNGIAEPALHAA